MPSRHSSIVGGSSAARMVNCPGSAALMARLPEILDKDSSYANEGTALHTAVERIITEKVMLNKVVGTIIETESDPVTITQELFHDALEPALEYWMDLMPKVDTWQLETEVEFPGIDGAFGTTDVLARDDKENITYVTDWKFGAGEGVKASYPDPDDERYELINEQLLFYACGARHTQPEFFPPDCRIVLTIVQPRARGQEPVTSVEISHDDLNAFESELLIAVGQSKKADAPTKKGRWCRFQACQTICPHHTGPLFDLKTITLHMPDGALKETAPTTALPVIAPNGVNLSKYSLLDILDAAPMVERLIAEARGQAHILLTNGDEVPGWKLVAKRGTRQWAVEPKVIARKLKIKSALLYDKVLKSPAQVEKLLPKKTKVPAALAPSVSSGTTIAKVSDTRPAIAADPTMISKIIVEALADEV